EEGEPAEDFGGLFSCIGPQRTELGLPSRCKSRMTNRTLPDIADADAVLAAFDEAKEAGRPSVECYRAAVDAWRHLYPDQSAEYAAKQAVGVILATRGAEM